MKTKPKVFMDYCFGCDKFDSVSRHGHMVRGLCRSCLGKLLKSFDLPAEYRQLNLLNSEK